MPAGPGQPEDLDTARRRPGSRPGNRDWQRQPEDQAPEIPSPGRGGRRMLMYKLPRLRLVRRQ